MILDADRPLPTDITEKVGEIVKIGTSTNTKRLISVGNSETKPTEIDNVVLSLKGFIVKATNDGYVAHTIKQFFFINKEYSLEESSLPKIVRNTIESMRKDEECEISMNLKSITNFLKNKSVQLEKSFFENLSCVDDASKMFENTDYALNKYVEWEDVSKEDLESETKLFLYLKLNDFFVVQNLTNNGEIRKKILRNGNEWYYPKEQDYVECKIECFADEELLYTKVVSEFIDKAFFTLKSLNAVEKRIISNMKQDELAEVYVKNSFFEEHYKEFLHQYPQVNGRIITYNVCLMKVVKFTYIFRDHTRYGRNNKRLILQEGIGQDSPDRESYVKLKLFIRIDDKVVYDNFELDHSSVEGAKIINFKNSIDSEDYLKFRSEQNQKLSINFDNMDQERDPTTAKLVYDDFSQACFRRMSFILGQDIKLYSIPLSLRKVLIHMKRNEISLISTNFLDFFKDEDFQLGNISKDVNPYKLEGVEPKIEILVHLFEFANRPIFSNMNYRDKLEELNYMKSNGNIAFKSGNFYQAAKIYNNTYYRFTSGDVFGNSSQIATDNLKVNDSPIFQQLIDVKVSCALNLSTCKLKLNRFEKVIEVTKEILKNKDDIISSETRSEKEVKAIYLQSKALINLNSLESIEEALALLSSNSDILKGKPEFDSLFIEADDRLKLVKSKQKSLYKKMIFSKD